MIDRPRIGPQLQQKTRVQTGIRVLSFVHICAMAEENAVQHLTEQAGVSPALALSFSVTPPKRRPWRPAAMVASNEALPGLVATGGSLTAHVQEQLGWLVPDRRLHPVAMAWLERLEPSGWVSATPAEVAQAAGVAETTATDILGQLQKAEPSGLFSRTLKECLAGQLEAESALTPPMQTLLDNLPLLADGALGELASLCGVDQSGIAVLIGQLRGLNPKPGADFGAAAPLPPSPYLYLYRDDNGGWELERNSFIKPTLSIDAAAQAKLTASDRALIRSVEDRDALVFRTVRAALDHQGAFLDGQIPAPRVMTSAMLADRLGVHETTVGRIRKHLTLGTDAGQIALKDLFFRGIGQGATGPVSAPELVIRIRNIMSGGNGRLSDREISGALAEAGLTVSRRTVATYRRQIDDRRARR